MPSTFLTATIAIPTYNRAALLSQTLAGLVNQDYPRERFEILIIDNNSPDKTRQTVEQFAHAPKPPRYVLETQQGANFARNRALAESKADVIVYGDDDILVDPDWLSSLLSCLQLDAAGRIGAVGGEVVPIFPEGCPPWVAGFHGPQALRAHAGPIQPRQVPMSASLAFRREVLINVGGWDTALGRKGNRVFGGEENGPLRRLRKAGFEVWFEPRSRVLHQMPATRTTLRYVLRHAHDSARSRVVGRCRELREDGKSANAYLLSRLPSNLLKAVGYAAIAFLNAVVFRRGAAKKSLVRAWRSCGYVRQVIASLTHPTPATE